MIEAAASPWRRLLLGAARCLALAAAPAFALMALLAGLPGGAAPADLCSSGPEASPLGGMAAMYLSMSVVHAGPWLRLLAGLALPRRRVRPADRGGLPDRP